MTNPAAKPPSPRSNVAAAIGCGLAGFILFQFFGNATRGYIPSTSLFYWWGFQWMNPGSETEHGWLILGLSIWVWWRNLRIADCGLRIVERWSRPEDRERSPEAGNRKPEEGNQGPETGGRKPETGGSEEESGERKPETGGGRMESGEQKLETGGGRMGSGEGKPKGERAGTAERKVEIVSGTGDDKTESSFQPPPDSGLGIPDSIFHPPVSGLRTSDSPLRIPDSKSPQSAIRNAQWAPSSVAPAIFAIASGLALHALGFAAQQTRLSILAFLLFTWGVVRLGGGRRWGNAAMFPLAFMVFAIPISALDEIGLPLRLWVTDAGERIAHLAGIDVVRSGTQLVAPDGRFNYDVAAPCSGVRSLTALTALSVLIGYLNFRSWWRRALVLGLSFPLVYLGNVARIVAIIFAAQAGGPAWGDRAHDVMGYGVFVIVLGGVLGATMVIRKWMPDAREETGVRSPETGVRSPETSACGMETCDNAEPIAGCLIPSACRPSPTSPLSCTRSLQPSVSTSCPPVSGLRTPVSRLRTPVFCSATVLFLIGLEMLFLHRLAQLPPRGQVGVILAEDGMNPAELPAFLGTEWIGQRARISEVEREILPPDTGFSRKNYAFVADRMRDVFLSIVLSGRDRTSIHRPELCLVGQGWTIEGASRQTFHMPAEGPYQGGEFPATVLRVRREVASAKGRIVVPQLVAYWFVAGDTIVASHWERFLHDAWNRVARGRADRWAYVLMQTDAREGEAAALARMQTVLDGTLPAFQKVVTSGRRS